MEWERTKASVRELPLAPSLRWWSLSGALALMVGALLFLLHASGTVPALANIDIWQLSLAVPGAWLLMLSLRGWWLVRATDEYVFLQNEAQFAQEQWEAWAGRHLAILAGSVQLPDGLTAAVIHEPSAAIPSRGGLTRRMAHIHDPLKLCLAGVEEALSTLPPDLPLRVTLVSDSPVAQLTETFARHWASRFPLREPPDDITVTASLSLQRMAERLKQPELTVDLILLMQLNGGEAYSDWLASLLLTSDDVALIHNLAHPARLLRPMALDMAAFERGFTLFLETQTVACTSVRTLADALSWEKSAASLMTTGARCGAAWQPAERLVLEKLCGIPSPMAPWLVVVLASELVRLSKVSMLTLFSSGTEHYVSTVTSGDEDANNG
ncbi:type VI secretion protein [Erwinia sp. B116]|uniref:type VI secretion protein n=1 Tax=Erwinia sp. B116 TaxID=1561024 RepID=UPI000C762276|nr:type VI secretion protein [Erwinia sp. B116]PLV54505.1 hypothetical protein NV64_17885 [Erwinia sp. B116]